MSKIDNNPILKGVSGMLGETVQFRTIHGRMQLANKPKRRKNDSDRQLTTQSRFSRASRYANKQLLIPEAKEMYAARVNERLTSAYLVAMADFLNGPTILGIETDDYSGVIGNRISVGASDDFMVKSVRVAIIDSNGVKVEEGEAQPDPEREDYWLYTCNQTNDQLSGTVIRVVVKDRPGNTAKDEVAL